jgi:hypothetical protein
MAGKAQCCYATHFEEETVVAAMPVPWARILCYAIPMSLCTDQKSVLVTDREPQDADVPLGRGVDLRSIFCVETTRTVSNNCVVRHNNRWYQRDREA